MAQTPTQIITGVFIPTTASVLYQSQNAANTKISQFVINNTDQINPHQVFIYFAPSTASPGLQTLLEIKTLAAGESYMVYRAVNEIIPPGGTIQMSCPTPNVVSVFVSANVIT